MKRLALIFICCCLSASVYAENSKSPSVSPWLYKKLSKTEKLIEKKSYQTARQQLQKILKNTDNNYERAVVLRSLSSVYALQGNYKQAASFLKKALALNVLPEKQKLQALLNLGQLYMATGQYSQAVKVLEPWLTRNPHPDSETSALLANAYSQLKQYRKALPHIKRAIANSKKPPESWYQLNLALLYELNDYPSAAKLLIKLLNRHPDNKDYWRQLVSVYQQLRQYKKASSVQYLAYKTGLFTREKDILALVNILSYIDAPYKGATLLQAEIKRKRVRSTSKNWELLASQWQQARELDKAINALKTASKLSPKGKLYLQLGQIYTEQENWPQAIDALTSAISKGGLNNPGAAWLLLGISHYESGHIKQAWKAFNQASHYKKQKKQARQWLSYINSDKQHP